MELILFNIHEFFGCVNDWLDSALLKTSAIILRNIFDIITII